MNDFIEELQNDEYEILTDEGWKDFSGIAKTKELDVFEVITESGKKLKCSFNHLLKTESEWIKTSDILGKSIQTTDGFEKVLKNRKIGKENLFDVLDVENQRYLTNDILSHNCGKSTSFEIFICWILLFQKDQRIAVLANKAEQSYDILRKVKEAYELLPKWLQQGVKIWNAGRIKLENGSMVIASSTSSTAIRGKSIGCVTGKNKIKVRCKETGVIKEMSLDELNFELS